MKKKLFLLVVALGLGSCMPVVAQTKPRPYYAPTEPDNKLATAQVSNGNKVSYSEKVQEDNIAFALTHMAIYGMTQSQQDADEIKGLPELYQKGLLVPTVGNFILSELMLRHVGNIGTAMNDADVVRAVSQSQVNFLTVIASQNQILIQQNKQMIELLTKIANKK